MKAKLFRGKGVRKRKRKKRKTDVIFTVKESCYFDRMKERESVCVCAREREREREREVWLSAERGGNDLPLLTRHLPISFSLTFSCVSWSIAAGNKLTL